MGAVMRVVLFGCSEKNATLLQRVMQDIPGCAATVFSEATLALQDCMAHEPDLLLLDATSPNSLTLLEKFRALHAEVPVLVVGAGDKSLRLATLGASDFLASPLVETECRLRIKNLLDLRQTRLELAKRTSWLADEVNQAFQALELTATQAQEITEIAETNLKLEAENRNKSDFLARVSHDLRAPLATIMGYSELIASAVPSHRSELAVIGRNAHHLLGLIDELLEFTRNTLHLSPVYTEPVDLFELIEGVMQQAQVLADASGNRVTLMQSGSPPQMLMLDAVPLKRVLSNLLSNAVKFTCEGTVSLQVSVANNGNVADGLLFEVIDSGVGIEAAEQERVFEPFYRAAQTASNVPGTGLGLAICRQLAEAMGGYMTVQSAPGKGSCFALHLPCVVVDEGGTTVAPVGGRLEQRALFTQNSGGAALEMQRPVEGVLEPFQRLAEQGALSQLEKEAVRLAQCFPEYTAFSRFVLEHCATLEVEKIASYCAKI